MCTDGAGQLKVYRRTRTFLKIRSRLTDGKAKAQIEEWKPETANEQFQATAVPDENRNLMVDNSADRSTNGDSYTPPLQQNLPNVPNISQEREEDSQDAMPPCTSGIASENAPSVPGVPDAPNTPVQRKSTRKNLRKEPK